MKTVCIYVHLDTIMIIIQHHPVCIEFGCNKSPRPWCIHKDFLMFPTHIVSLLLVHFLSSTSWNKKLCLFTWPKYLKCVFIWPKYLKCIIIWPKYVKCVYLTNDLKCVSSILFSHLFFNTSFSDASLFSSSAVFSQFTFKYRYFCLSADQSLKVRSASPLQHCGPWLWSSVRPRFF